jgi:hypothetical protein
MQTDTDNPTAAPTGVSNSTAGSNALFGHATDDGTGVGGTSGFGIGSLGTSADTSDPETNTRNAGVVGVAGDFTHIATNVGLTGVYGYSDPSTIDGFVGTGVWGDCDDFGVFGSGAIGVEGVGVDGVIGFTTVSGGAGVVAAADPDVASARALLVDGKAEFSRSGRATIKAGSAKKTVTLARCSANTLVLAVLANNRSGRWIRAVVPASGQFTIYLNNSVSSSTQVTWIAFTNPTTHSG